MFVKLFSSVEEMEDYVKDSQYGTEGKPLICFGMGLEEKDNSYVIFFKCSVPSNATIPSPNLLILDINLLFVKFYNISFMRLWIYN